MACPEWHETSEGVRVVGPQLFCECGHDFTHHLCHGGVPTACDAVDCLCENYKEA